MQKQKEKQNEQQVVGMMHVVVVVAAVAAVVGVWILLPQLIFDERGLLLPLQTVSAVVVVNG
jgi:hypothetical protein